MASITVEMAENEKGEWQIAALARKGKQESCKIIPLNPLEPMDKQALAAAAEACRLFPFPDGYGCLPLCGTFVYSWVPGGRWAFIRISDKGETTTFVKET
jgi:hypothetical protein